MNKFNNVKVTYSKSVQTVTKQNIKYGCPKYHYWLILPSKFSALWLVWRPARATTALENGNQNWTQNWLQDMFGSSPFVVAIYFSSLGRMALLMHLILDNYFTYYFVASNWSYYSLYYYVITTLHYNLQITEHRPVEGGGAVWAVVSCSVVVL